MRPWALVAALAGLWAGGCRGFVTHNRLDEPCAPKEDNTWEICVPPAFCSPANGKCRMPFSASAGEACFGDFECDRGSYCPYEDPVTTRNCKPRLPAGSPCKVKRGPSGSFLEPWQGGRGSLQCAVGSLCLKSPASGDVEPDAEFTCRKLWQVDHGESAPSAPECKPWLGWDAGSGTCMELGNDKSGCTGGSLGEETDALAPRIIGGVYEPFKTEPWGYGSDFCQSCPGSASIFTDVNSRHCFPQWRAWALYEGNDAYARSRMRYDFLECRGHRGEGGKIWWGMSADTWTMIFMILMILSMVWSAAAAFCYHRSRKKIRAVRA